MLHASSSRKNLSAAEQERREEDKRRRERSQDVVVGKTSALDGATDYALDISATEQEWLRQTSETEREIARQTDLGLQMLKMMRLREANKAFDRVFELKPNAYLWQAGIARFYLGDLEEASSILSRCAEIYETRFGEPASEERLWRNACLLKSISAMSRKERKLFEQEREGGLDSLLPKPPTTEETADLLRSERRKVIRISRELFSCTVGKDHTGIILARAKLRSIGGALDDIQQAIKLDKKKWKISSWFYLGLHYDVIGDAEESKKCMKRALRLCPNANGSDVTHSLPMMHMTYRDWYDDESFEDEDDDDLENEKASFSSPSTSRDQPKKKSAAGSSLNSLQSTIPVPDNVDPALIESIQSSLKAMRYLDLQCALKVRGLRAIGSKEELQGRLFRSLLTDTGLMP